VYPAFTQLHDDSYMMVDFKLCETHNRAFVEEWMSANYNKESWSMFK